MVYDPRGGGNVHIDVALTQISVAYPNNPFVGERLFPTVRVRKQSDLYYVFGREGWGSEPGSDVRAPGTLANEIPGLEVSTSPYFAVEHSLQIPVTDEERENTDSPMSPDRDGTEHVTSRILFGRERAMRDMVTTTGNYAAGHSTTLAGVNQWSDLVNSDPIGNIKTARRTVHAKLFMDLNTAVIPWQVMSVLEDHPDFIERIKYSERGIVTPEIIAAMFGIPNVIVPGLGENTANSGQTVNLDYLWGKDVVLAWVPPRAGLRVPAFAYEFVQPIGGQVQVVDRWREQPRKSDLIRVSRRYDLKFIAVDSTDKAIAGYLIKDAVA